MASVLMSRHVGVLLALCAALAGVLSLAATPVLAGCDGDVMSECNLANWGDFEPSEELCWVYVFGIGYRESNEHTYWSIEDIEQCHDTGAAPGLKCSTNEELGRVLEIEMANAVIIDDFWDTAGMTQEKMLNSMSCLANLELLSIQFVGKDGEPFLKFPPVYGLSSIREVIFQGNRLPDNTQLTQWDFSEAPWRSTLERLQISDNGFVGSIPSLGGYSETYPQLHSIGISERNIVHQSTFPFLLEHLPKLVHLDLSRTQIQVNLEVFADLQDVAGLDLLLAYTDTYGDIVALLESAVGYDVTYGTLDFTGCDAITGDISGDITSAPARSMMEGTGGTLSVDELLLGGTGITGSTAGGAVLYFANMFANLTSLDLGNTDVHVNFAEMTSMLNDNPGFAANVSRMERLDLERMDNARTGVVEPEGGASIFDAVFGFLAHMPLLEHFYTEDLNFDMEIPIDNPLDSLEYPTGLLTFKVPSRSHNSFGWTGSMLHFSYFASLEKLNVEHTDLVANSGFTEGLFAMLENLGNLEFLEIAGNDAMLLDTPADFPVLPNVITKWTLDGISFSGIKFPTGPDNPFRDAKHVSMSDCDVAMPFYITEVDEMLVQDGSFDDLENLYLDGNAFETFPWPLAPELQIFSINGAFGSNSLGEFPDENSLAELPNIKEFHCQNCYFQGGTFNASAHWPDLRELVLTGAQFNSSAVFGLQHLLQSSTVLTHVDMRYCGIGGALELHDPAVEYLDLSHNYLRNVTIHGGDGIEELLLNSNFLEDFWMDTESEIKLRYLGLRDNFLADFKPMNQQFDEWDRNSLRVDFCYNPLSAIDLASVDVQWVALEDGCGDVLHGICPDAGEGMVNDECQPCHSQFPSNSGIIFPFCDPLSSKKSVIDQYYEESKVFVRCAATTSAEPTVLSRFMQISDGGGGGGGTKIIDTDGDITIGTGDYDIDGVNSDFSIFVMPCGDCATELHGGHSRNESIYHIRRNLDAAWIESAHQIGVCGECAEDEIYNAEASVCEQCGNGHVPNNELEFVGEFPSEYQGSVCVACGTGRFAVSGDIECGNCELGQYPAPSLDSCDNCPVGTYHDYDEGVDSVAYCIMCEPGTYVSALEQPASECEPCRDNTYGLAMGQSQCIPCPENGVCSVGSTKPYPQTGYWESEDGAYVFLQCPITSLCLGGQQNECADGHEGDLCAYCKENWYMLNDRCDECPDYKLVILIIAIVVMIVLLAMLYMLGSGASRVFGAPMITLNFVQIVGIFPTLNLPWPDELMVIFNIFDYCNLSLEASSPECNFDFIDFRFKWWFMMLLPFMLVGILSTVMGTAMFVHKFVYPFKKGVMYIINRTIKGYTILMSVLYLILCERTFAIFDCTVQPNGTATLDADPSTLCWESEHYKLFGPGIFFLMLYAFAYPMLVMYIVHKGTKKQHFITDINYHDRFIHLADLYKPQFWYWELVIFWRKFAFVAAKTFFTTRFVAQIVLTMCVLGIALGIQLYYRAYTYRYWNIMETSLLSIAIFILSIGLVYLKWDDDVPEWVGIVSLVLILAIICVSAVAVFFELTRYFASREKKAFRGPFLYWMRIFLSSHEIEESSEVEFYRNQMRKHRDTSTKFGKNESVDELEFGEVATVHESDRLESSTDALTSTSGFEFRSSLDGLSRQGSIVSHEPFVAGGAEMADVSESYDFDDDDEGY